MLAEGETQDGGLYFRPRASFHGGCSDKYIVYVFQVPEAGIVVTRQNTSFLCPDFAWKHDFSA